MSRTARVALLGLLLAGCATPGAGAAAPAPPGAWLDRLYLGRSVEGVHAVSDAAWDRFLHEVVTPRFPDGYTVLRGEGRWRGADSTEAELTFVLEVVHPGDAASEVRMREVADAYRERFRQEAVLRVRVRADPALLH